MLKLIAKEKLRVDKYLDLNMEETRSKIQKLINNDKVLVNGKIVKNNHILKENDIIEINQEYVQPTTIKKEQMTLDIVYEDNDIIVINKASGMVVHPAPGHYQGTLVNGLLNHTSVLSDNGDRPGIVHRIDKDTSGLLLVAKNEVSHQFLVNQLKEHKVKRIYIALVDGIINHDTGTIDAPIGRDPKDRKKMAVTEINSKVATTHFVVMKRYDNATLIECRLETGRTHQIRVHLKYIGHPIINDPVYNSQKNIDNYGQLLHAGTISFVHPTTNETMTFTADLPDKFKEILKIYEK